MATSILLCISGQDRTRNWIAKGKVIVYLYAIRRAELIKVLQKQFMEATTKNLPIYGVSTKQLKDFLTSEKDQLR